MNRYKNPNKFLQYELWKDCKLGCKFCCNKGAPDLNKIESLTFVLNKLDDVETINYNEVGFIGGEFFNGELSDIRVRKLFYNIFEKLSRMHFNKIYFTTALIFDIDLYLVPFLNYLRELNILSKCLLCTSYDTKYRFYTEQRENLWKNNMLRLHKDFPELKIHTETILTQYFIDSVLSNEFSITEFCNKYHTRIDYIEPGSGLYYHDKKDCSKDIPGFFPTKSSFIKFLEKVLVKNKEIEPETFLSMELRSSKLYYIDDGKRMVIDNRRNTDGRGHPIDKTKKYEIGFIDSDDTMADISKLLFEAISE